MKNKVLIVTLIVILLFSVVSFVSASVKCPRCQGTGKITETQTCPLCGGEAETTSVVRKKIFPPQAGGNNTHPATIVSGLFYNELADGGVYAVVTAEVKSSTETYTNTSAETYFPPREDVTVTVIVEGIECAPYLSCNIYLSSGGKADCPECGGTGIATVTIDCPDCGGTGFVAALPQDETNSFIVWGAAVGVAAAVVISLFLVVKRKKVTEASLRRMLPTDFQNWVLQRFSGGTASQKDSSMGIDGYTVEGYPIQIKQLEDVSRSTVDSFASAMGRSKARTGVIVAFSFDNGAYERAVRARLHYGFEIKMVTVRELIESPSRTY